jgi:hypothetical protein
MADIEDSILWRNAGGSVESNGATVNITCSLSEDGADLAKGVICCDPKYVGWGSLKIVYVSASASSPGTGAPFKPYRDLQLALKDFSFNLAYDSPCVGSACDGGNMGADTGIGGTAGNITALLYLRNGTYDIRGRNIIFIRGVQGTDPNTTIIRHAVFGYIEDAYLRNVGITGEEIFGGITVRADVQFDHCNVAGNTSLADGGGIYMAGGNCAITNSSVSQNTSSGNGGGYFASSGTNTIVEESTVSQNTSTGSGGGLYLDVNSVSSLLSRSQILNNTSHNSGGGIYVGGLLDVTDVNVINNKVDMGRGGGIYINGTGDVSIVRSYFLNNSAGGTSNGRGGGINSYGRVDVHLSNFESNTARYLGGAVEITEERHGSSSFTDCNFIGNHATAAGAVFVYQYTSPTFTKCNFDKNTSQGNGGALWCTISYAKFDRCCFTENSASYGGTAVLYSSGTVFRECTFKDNSAVNRGGCASISGSDSSLFEDCSCLKSTAGELGGAFHILGSAGPVFSNVQIICGGGANYGGGIAIFEIAKPMFSQVVISGCSAVIFGGGVYATDNTQGVFEECEFLNNRTSGISSDGGGAFFRANANGSFTRCVFQNNTAKDEQATLDLRNTLFTDNIAGNTGGGAYFTSTSVGTFTNCTFVSNQANGKSGGGIYLDPNNAVNVNSSIFCQNSPDGIRCEPNLVVRYSCVQEICPGTGPGNRLCDDCCQLDPDTFGLQDGSPCIDGGNPDMNDACQPPGKKTLRNDMGITGGPDNRVVVPDADIDSDGRVDFDDFERFASQWLETSTIIIPKSADLDYNCRVDFHDFSILAKDWLGQQ